MAKSNGIGLMDKGSLLEILSYLNERLKENQLNLVKFTFNLSDNWINEEIKEPLKLLLKEDKETYKVYSNLKILKPKAEQLLAMLLGERQINFIKYLGEDLGYDWE